MPLIDNGTNYETEFRVADYECDAQNRMKLSFILRHMQEISGRHLDALDLPYELLRAKGQVFLLSRIHLRIYSRPVRMQKVRLVTAPKEPVGTQFLRVNELYDQGGSCILRADTAWLLVDPGSRRILRPRAFEAELPMKPDPLAAAVTRIKLQRPADCAPVFDRPIRYSDLDVNCHVNNAIYADMVEDALPPALHDKEPLSLFLHFRNEALMDDTVRLSRGKADNKWYIIGEKQGGVCFEALYEVQES